MRRKLDSSLDVWIRSNHRKPLVLFGARGVGKTTLLDTLASRSGKQLVRIDFSTDAQARAAFEVADDPREIARALSVLKNRPINSSNTLLVLDEIQLCDDALMSLRRFKTDMPELALAAAGSSLGVHLARGSHAVLPTEHVNTETVRPLDFEEFCWALGEGRAYEIAAECAAQMKPCLIHEKMMGLYREYLLVGGMPQAVARYRQARQIAAARREQESIRMLYTATMAEYPEGVDPAKISATWRSLPAQLAKSTGSTKFMWKYIARGAKAERYASALEWLQQAGMVNVCTQVSGASSSSCMPAHAPEGANPFENPSSFKAYVADTGLLAQAYSATLADFATVDSEPAGAQVRAPTDLHQQAPTGPTSSATSAAPVGARTCAPAQPAPPHQLNPTPVGARTCAPAQPAYRQPLFTMGIAENFVMQELVAAGQQPHYWGMKSKHEAQFVLETEEGAVPIDVAPTAKRTRSAAARDFASRYNSPYILQVTSRNIDYRQYDGHDIRTIPPYALFQVVA